VKYIFIVLALFAGPVAAESETYLEIGAGKNGNLLSCSICWHDGGGVAAYISIRNQWSNGLFIHLTHFSQYDVGPPFNQRAESTIDHLGIGMRWRVR
tara:strand:- start:580 stop:870 length:291 start_codon:yes stop_codon:yes gene_type:complete